MVVKKNDEIVLQKKLIKLVKGWRSIYDRNYVKQNERKILTKYGWREISIKIGKTEEECKKKWKNIRQSYYRSLKEKKCIYYLQDQLEFLQPYLVIDSNTKEIINKMITPAKISQSGRRYSRFENERDQYPSSK